MYYEVHPGCGGAPQRQNGGDCSSVAEGVTPYLGAGDLIQLTPAEEYDGSAIA
jgi:hypothetical protein